jgi:uncharacterized protein (TIGR02145 family)
MNQLTGIDIWGYTTEPRYTYYELNLYYERVYGKLYNGFVVGNDKNVCPIGWKIPADSDFTELVHYIDPNSNTDSLLWGLESPTAHLELISTGSIPTDNGLWGVQTGASNSTGFSVLPTGVIEQSYEDAYFHSMSEFGLLWSTTPAHEFEDERFYSRYFCPFSGVHRFKTLNVIGAPIRCLKDVNYDSSAQIEEIKIDYTVYPNPVVDQLNVVVDLSSIGSEYTISDMNGKILMKGQIPSQEFQIDMSGLSGGGYFINIEGKQKRIVKS